jgi:hypothetical protein
MRSFVIALPVILALGLMAAAQMQGPPPEMKKFDVMLGNWEGTGTAKMVPDQPAGEWTAVSTIKKIMGGHFVQENVRIDIGPDMPQMIFYSVYSWDPAAKRYMCFMCGNMGAFTSLPVYWTEDGKLVNGGVATEHGNVMTDRAVTEFSDDEVRFKCLRAAGSGEFYVCLQGSMKRGGPGFAVTGETAGVSLSPPDEHVKAVAPMAGNWSFKGRMKMMSGSPWMDISGQEAIEPILGGHVYVSRVTGDPIPDMPRYEGLSFTGWDEQANCLKTFGFCTMGDAHGVNVYPKGDKRLIFTNSAVYHGHPMVQRMVLEISDDGNGMKIWSDSITADGDPERCFEGTYTKTKT